MLFIETLVRLWLVGDQFPVILPCRAGGVPRAKRRKRAPGRDALAPENREKVVTDRHGGPTRAQFPERGKQGVNQVYDLARFVKILAAARASGL